ncbi:MAG: heterocyst differentiation protein HetZ [Symploca sp. SIO3C6]|uniref:Heterocyst differentiation protein HetZ n=1 Tax=Symploca sp. SIO1C4 TaxID=2607765 RepID=A0A6B3NH58_9CYAN|nr:heterocyst differentiation protein HetZ [Symploca sp. SIO3C6]NER29354.1 heterocyst differentiation protein HetZ [Symploca sp. SIO1C4]NET03792.1 heterocyst differentiation protein HetZ [Symploca sp. SIO2B6]
MREVCQDVETISTLLFDEFRQGTRASERSCRNVAARLADEVTRICNESRRIQSSGEVDDWAKTLANHRLKQCLRYYKLGSHGGRVELQSTLSAIVYRYITPSQTLASYQARLTLIEDFLQGFYVEALNAFRRENSIAGDYRPRSLLELAEYMAFTERYGKRRIPLPGRRSQQLIILRAQTFSQQQPPETSVDMDTAAEGGAPESEFTWNDAAIQQVREVMVASEPEPLEANLRERVVEELLAYLGERQQSDCADYLTLRLQDLPTSEIEDILGITSRQRDYLQQRFKYHLIRFALSHRWELVHQWLGADLDRNLGMTPIEWAEFHNTVDAQQVKLLKLKQKGTSVAEIAQELGCSVTQVEKRWFKLLEKAWYIRNRSVSGSTTSQDE